MGAGKWATQNKIKAVDIRPGAAFQYGVPKPVFAAQIGGINPDLVASKDGRFPLPVPVAQGVRLRLHSRPLTTFLFFRTFFFERR